MTELKITFGKQNITEIEGKQKLLRFITIYIYIPCNSFFLALHSTEYKLTQRHP